MFTIVYMARILSLQLAFINLKIMKGYCNSSTFILMILLYCITIWITLYKSKFNFNVTQVIANGLVPPYVVWVVSISNVINTNLFTQHVPSSQPPPAI